MTCDEILPLLLDAEADELTGNSVTPIARHVRECNRCRAVAGRLRRETGALASVLARAEVNRPVVRPWRVRVIRWAAPGLAAAAAALLMLARDVPPGNEQTAAVPIVVAAPPTVPASTPAPPAPTRPSAPRAIRAEPFTLAPYTGLVAVAAVPVAKVPAAPAEQTTHDELAEAGPAADSVVVTPPRGTNVRVARTRNPSITVVWITNTK